MSIPCASLSGPRGCTFCRVTRFVCSRYLFHSPAVGARWLDIAADVKCSFVNSCLTFQHIHSRYVNFKATCVSFVCSVLSLVVTVTKRCLSFVVETTRLMHIRLTLIQTVIPESNKTHIFPQSKHCDRWTEILSTVGAL